MKIMIRPKRRRTLSRWSLIVAVVPLVLVGLSACADSENGAGNQSDKSFTYGYSKPTGQNPWINAVETTATEVAQAAGGKGETTDAQLDNATAVQQIGRFVNDGKDVVVVAPAQVPEAMQSALSKAQSAGIATLALEWSFSADAEAAPEGPIDGQVVMNRGELGKEVADEINQAFPEGAKVILVGLPFPVASIDFVEESFKAALGKSKLVADLDNPTDNAQGALGPLTSALSAHPDANAIVTYNGASATAAVQAAKSAGLEGKVKIYNYQADTGSMKALANGDLTAVWDLNPPSLGKALGEMMVAAANGEPKEKWAKTVVVKAPKYTPDSASEWEDWAN